jgi:hypothetical protein
LGRLGVTLWEATGARAAHPPPQGLSGFARRAFHAGQDACFYRALEAAPTLADCRVEWRKDRLTVRRRIAERAPQIGADGPSRIAGAVLGQVYYAIKALGYVTSLQRREPQPVAAERMATS